MRVWTTSALRRCTNRRPELPCILRSTTAYSGGSRSAMTVAPSTSWATCTPKPRRVSARASTSHNTASSSTSNKHGGMAALISFMPHQHAGERQLNPSASAAAAAIEQLHAAPQTLNGSLREKQAEPHTLAVRLGGEERFAKVRFHNVADPDATVAHLQPQVIAAPAAAAFDVVGRDVRGIVQNIGEGMGQGLIGDDPGRGLRSLPLLMERDMRPQFAPLPHHLGEVDDKRLAAPAERLRLPRRHRQRRKNANATNELAVLKAKLSGRARQAGAVVL